MKIDFYMDLTCPWCFIGFKRLQLAMAALPDGRFDIDFVGYQLRADLPAEGFPYRANLQKFFKSEESLQRHLAKVEAIGHEVGAAFAFDKNLVTCQTLDGHRLLKYTPEPGKMKLLDAMYKGVFSEAANLGQPEELAQIGERAGIGERKALLKFLRSDALKQEVLDDFAQSAKADIITIPFLVIDGTYPVQAAHLPDVIAFCISNI